MCKDDRKSKRMCFVHKHSNIMSCSSDGSKISRQVPTPKVLATTYYFLTNWNERLDPPMHFPLKSEMTCEILLHWMLFTLKGCTKNSTSWRLEAELLALWFCVGWQLLRSTVGRKALRPLALWIAVLMYRPVTDHWSQFIIADTFPFPW